MGVNTLEPAMLFTLATSAVGFIVWLMRVDGRVTANEVQVRELKDDIAEIKADVKVLLYGPRV